MNKIVQLVNEWSSFEETHPNADIGDFCRYYLIREREQRQEGVMVGGVVPPRTNDLLSKLLGRIVGIFSVYARKAVWEHPLQMEEFYFLNSIRFLGESKKTDIINFNLTELSTGMDILKRLKKAGLTVERTDPNDRRSKLVKATEKADAVLMSFYKVGGMVGDIMFGAMPEEDKQLCIQLLKNVEIRHSKRCIEHRNKILDEVYREECNELLSNNCYVKSQDGQHHLSKVSS
jgi:DNA-binding MarR family transcriptional regulator